MCYIRVGINTGWLSSHLMRTWPHIEWDYYSVGEANNDAVRCSNIYESNNKDFIFFTTDRYLNFSL